MAATTHTPRLRLRASGTLLIAILLTVSACAPIDEGDGATDAAGGTGEAPTGDGGELTIATGGTGGVYYPLGGGLADVISENLEGYTASVQETNASVDNMLLIGDGGADIAFTLADTAGDAVTGTGDDFADGPIEACALALIYNNYTQILTSTDAGVTSIDDLAGKRVSLGSPGSGTEVIALRILEAAGSIPMPTSSASSSASTRRSPACATARSTPGSGRAACPPGRWSTTPPPETWSSSRTGSTRRTWSTPTASTTSRTSSRRTPTRGKPRTCQRSSCRTSWS